jgi:hypothetical protein
MVVPAAIPRRTLLALGATLVLPAGCVTPLPSLRDVDLDAIGPDQALLLGRVRLSILGFDRSGDAFVTVSARAREELLPPEGEVAWVVRRIAGLDVRLMRVTSSGKTLVLGRGPLLAPAAVRTAINYFGTVEIAFEHGLNDNRATMRTHRAEVRIVDQAGSAMPAFVAQNPKLEGRMFYHVPRATMLQAPAPGPGPAPQG